MKKALASAFAILALIATACAKDDKGARLETATAQPQTSTVTVTGGSFTFPKGGSQDLPPIAPMTATLQSDTTYTLADFSWGCTKTNIIVATIYSVTNASNVSFSWDPQNPNLTTLKISVSVYTATNTDWLPPPYTGGSGCTASTMEPDATALDPDLFVKGDANVNIPDLSLSTTSTSGSSYTLENKALSIAAATQGSHGGNLADTVNRQYGLPGTGSVVARLTITGS